MTPEQILMGIMIAAVSAVGLWKDRWFLANTRKGERLVEWFGEERALNVLRGIFLIGILFGVLLAMNVIRPMQWE